MLECMTIEVRDRGTFIPCFAIKAHHHAEPDRYLLRRAGYGDDTPHCVIFGRLDCARTNDSATYDPHSWNNRTMKVAHQHVIEHWDEIASGSVIDVEFILGESSRPKQSERFI